jgi:hypothetical protein
VKAFLTDLAGQARVVEAHLQRRLRPGDRHHDPLLPQVPRDVLQPYFALGDRSRELLDRLKTWMGENNAVIMAVLLLVIGGKLIGDAISGFS